MRFLIIGGVAAGMSAAARLRRLNEDAIITVLERGPHISYANCGLPYYLGGVIASRDKLLIQTPQSFQRRFRVDVRVRHEALRIDRPAKKVTVQDLEGQRCYEESYDKLVLAPGGSPLRPPIPGIDHPAVFSLWTLADTDRIAAHLDAARPAEAVVVGGGFIGLEMTECLAHRGIRVHLVEALPQVLPNLDFEMAALLHRHLKAKGVELHRNDPVACFREAGRGLAVELKSGRQLDASLAILSIGVRPNTRLAAEAGLALGKCGGIAVDEHLQTSDPDIYAAGDAIEVPHPLLGRTTLIPLAGPANRQGRMVADNLTFGNRRRYRGTQGTWTVKAFDLTAAATGLSEKQCHAEQIDCRSVIIHTNSHAVYYPGATLLSLKLLFSPGSGRILGAQAIGREGVEKRIDVLATALQSGMTVDEVIEIEHAYAPPYSSAKDPVHLAGFAAENILRERIQVISWEEAWRADRAETHFLDVRTPGEYQGGHIAGARNIPVDELRARLEEIPRGKRIVVYCQVGLRGYIATRVLMQRGITGVSNLSGGFTTYDAAVASL